MCGSIRAYQVDHIDAFDAYHVGQVATIDGAYVAGVVSHMAVHDKHIWTLIEAGSSETDYDDYDACPCDAKVKILGWQRLQLI